MLEGLTTAEVLFPRHALQISCLFTSFLHSTGAVLDSLDHGTEQAMLSGLQTVKMIYSKDDNRGQPPIKPAVIWIPKEKFLTATNDGSEYLNF